jgi:hypothetical protein
MNNHNDQAALESAPYALPVYDDGITLGFVRISGQRWGGFDVAGRLLGRSHSEDSARRIVLAHTAQRCVS